MGMFLQNQFRKSADTKILVKTKVGSFYPLTYTHTQCCYKLCHQNHQHHISTMDQSRQLLFTLLVWGMSHRFCEAKIIWLWCLSFWNMSNWVLDWAQPAPTSGAWHITLSELTCVKSVWSKGQWSIHVISDSSASADTPIVSLVWCSIWCALDDGHLLENHHP